MAQLERAAIRPDTLACLDEQLRGERLDVESDDRKWPLRWAIFSVLATCLFLWLSISSVIHSIF